MRGEGWIKTYWKVRKSVAWSTGASAALWMEILLTTTKKKTILPTGDTLEAGQCILSQAKMAKWLGVSRLVVRKILQSFADDGMIEIHEVNRKGTTLSVCHWRTYQERNAKSEQKASRKRSESDQKAISKRSASEQKAIRKRTHTESPKSNRVIESKRGGATSSQTRPRPSGIEETRAYWRREDLAGDPGQFFDYYESRGWSGCTDWLALARTWSRREKEFGDKERAGRHDIDLRIPKDER